MHLTITVQKHAKYNVLNSFIREYVRNVDHANWSRSSRTQFGLSINVWRLAGDTLNFICNFLYCNHQVHRDYLITLYYVNTAFGCVYEYFLTSLTTNIDCFTQQLYRCILYSIEALCFLWGWKCKKALCSACGRNCMFVLFKRAVINPLAYTDVPETAGLARSINP